MRAVRAVVCLLCDTEKVFDHKEETWAVPLGSRGEPDVFPCVENTLQRPLTTQVRVMSLMIVASIITRFMSLARMIGVAVARRAPFITQVFSKLCGNGVVCQSAKVRSCLGEHNSGEWATHSVLRSAYVGAIAYGCPRDLDDHHHG